MKLKRPLLVTARRSIRAQVVRTVLVVDVPFAVLATIAFVWMMGFAVPTQDVILSLLVAALFLAKVSIWTPFVGHVLAPAERAVAAGASASQDLLERGLESARRAMFIGPVTAALAWGSMFFGSALIVNFLAPAALPFGWRSLLAAGLYATALIVAALPVTYGIFAWKLLPITGQLSLAARAHTHRPLLGPPQIGESLRARLALLGLCFTLAPTLWLMSLGYGLELIRHEPHLLFFRTSVLFCVIAVLWAVLATAGLNGAIGSPMAHISAVVAKIAATGGAVSDRAPVYEEDEVGRLAESVNCMADRLADVENTKRQFIAVAAHELRTPLAIIKGYSQLLRQHPQAEGAWRAPLASIERGTERIDTIVEHLLEFAQLQLGSIAFRRRQLDLARLVAEIVTREGSTRERDICVRAGQPCPVDVDPDRLARVLQALLSNAAKYSAPAAPIDVEVKRGAETATVRVLDRGIGIPAALQYRIFEPFYRADADRSSDTGGIGLGLYTAREVVRQHGGDMGFSSEEGKGSTFWFRLPLVPGEDHAR